VYHFISHLKSGNKVLIIIIIIINTHLCSFKSIQYETWPLSIYFKSSKHTQFTRETYRGKWQLVYYKNARTL